MKEPLSKETPAKTPRLLKRPLFILFFEVLAALLSAQSVRDSNASGPGGAGAEELPLRRLALFSSGVGFFEHRGTLTGSPEGAEISLPFDRETVNDALKSLIINDPAAASPTVRYTLGDSLTRTLGSLRIDLSGEPGIGELLGGQRGAEIEVSAPVPVLGRILGVEWGEISRPSSGEFMKDPWLILHTPQGIRRIAVRDISSFSFRDEGINRDLTRALDLIMGARDERVKTLRVSLPGAGSREVSLGYVIPVPVWKVSYRLDLSQEKPFLQGWAIVDNDSGADWDNVTLSLVTGRPVSFIQNLYAPYRTFRPTLPLAIAGTAEGRTYDSGWDDSNYMLAEERADYSNRASPAPKWSETSADSGVLMQEAAPSFRDRAPLAGVAAAGAAASGAAAGDQFEFTLDRPLTLKRRKSAMIPLVEGTIRAEKVLVLEGSRISGNGVVNPAIGAELTNTTGTRLPAGPITVYDGGSYAGDALIAFISEGEKRLISYGEDLTVTGSSETATGRVVTSVTLSGGVMTINRRQSYERSYSVKNASGEAKRIIIEHPVTRGTGLAEPKEFEDRTNSVYRFIRPLPANQGLTLTVKEEAPLQERITLAQLRPESFVSYASNQEIPANVRAALRRGMELKRKADEASGTIGELENQLARLVAEQDRIRKNLEAAGNTSPQGQDYLTRMAALDGRIDALNNRIDGAEKSAGEAKEAYDAYIASLNL
jgi:outer membrane murein-binding lipoprotein Lpp